MKNVLKSPAFSAGQKKRVGQVSAPSPVDASYGVIKGGAQEEFDKQPSRYPSSELELALLKIEELEQEKQQLEEKLEDYVEKLDHLVETKAERLSDEIILSEKQKIEDQLSQAGEVIRTMSRQLESTVEGLSKEFEAEIVMLAYEAICGILSQKAIAKEVVEDFVRSLLNSGTEQPGESSDHDTPVTTRMTDRLTIVLPETSYSEYVDLKKHVGINVEYSRHIDSGCLVKRDGRTLDYRIATLLSHLKLSLINTFEKYYSDAC